LARPYTRAINDFIYNKIRRTGVNYWFDLNDRSSEDTFTYTNGRRPSFQNWESGEPNNGGWWTTAVEDCVAYDEDDDYKWNDQGCGKKFRYVCQMDAIFHQG